MSEEIKEVEETEESKEIKEDDGTYSYEERRAAMARNNKAEMMDGVKEFGLGILALAGFMLYYVLLLGSFHLL